jgi:preprotein translocase subunit SecB
MNTETNSENEQSGSHAQFSIEKIYVKDLSFETPNSPGIFQKKWKPMVNMDLANSATSLNQDFYEVVLSITVTVSFEKVYLVEVQQAGIFKITKVPDEILKRMLNTVCPNILFPFVREVISDLVTKGGFPQLILAPVNFDALYQQQSDKIAKAN